MENTIERRDFLLTMFGVGAAAGLPLPVGTPAIGETLAEEVISPSVITTGVNPRVLWPGIKKWWGEAYDAEMERLTVIEEFA